MRTTILRPLFLFAFAPFAVACSEGTVSDDLDLVDGGGTGEEGGFTLDGGEDALSFDVPDGVAKPCEGLRCQQTTCTGGADTTITGTVYAPNGKLPLYNVIVYVPNLTPLPLTKGATCDKCGAVASGDPIVTALTDYQGKFTLKNVPVGSDIPLVIQLGKWRRQVKIPSVKACVDNPLTDPNVTRLPRNQKEGDMPKIAVTLGGCDKLSCMLPKVGIDASEFGADGSPAAVHFYQPGGGFFGGGGPAGMKDARVLWDNPAKLKEYDIAIFSCECFENSPGSKDAKSFAAVDQYLKAGGRIFTTDFQYLWYKSSPDPAMKAVMPIPGGAPSGTNPVDLDTSFTKGKALADWMSYVDKSVTYGKVQCDYVFNNFSPADKTKAQVWAHSKGISGAAGSSINPRFVTINTPVGKPIEEQCGKAVHLDAHINGSDTIDGSFPAGCKSAIKAGEEAFAFFFFDLASCIQKDGDPPKPPPVK
ncbi:MAG: carboxypeptidase regulatory-like domain-containing protein [Myxococcales bacterium]|nr:carboxypeptidase regulatory-like domain-containing protein [Myxococcales bacterium]